MSKISIKIILYLFITILISACHTLEHNHLLLNPVNKIIFDKKAVFNTANNNKDNLLPKKKNVSNLKLKESQKTKKDLKKISVIKSKKIKIKSFNPKSILNLSEIQLFKKIGKSDFVKHEGKLKNHQYYFSNCFVDIFLIKKEIDYYVDLFQIRPTKLNGFLNNVICLKNISEKINRLKQ